MKVIRESAEHHFLTTLEQLKTGKTKGWTALYFALSKNLPHSMIIEDQVAIEQHLSAAKQQGESFVQHLHDSCKGLQRGYIYLFSDNDVVALVQCETPEEKVLLQELYKQMQKNLPGEIADSTVLGNEFYNYQKLVDKKLLSAKAHHAYRAMVDSNKVSSIPVRRSRREHPQVLIIEDDRFTASYTANILSKDYDLNVARNGEEGIISYIENAPDIVFLDIHLPGLNGHETLQAIRAVDPKAFVVMLSVDTARENIKQASDIGAQNFLKKPFSKERLIHTVRNSPYVRSLFARMDSSIMH